MPTRGPAGADTDVDVAAGRGRSAARLGLAVAVVVAGLLTVAVTTGSRAVDGFDGAVTRFTRSWADAWGWPVPLAEAIGRVTAPGWSVVVALLLVALLLVRGFRAVATFLALSAAGGVAVIEVVKLGVGRTRPQGAAQFVADTDKSFPSGHAAAGIYLYLTTGLVLIHLGRASQRRWMVHLGWVLVAVGPLIGLSRIVLGVHWPTDVLAGWAYGSALALGSALLLWYPLARGWRPGSR